MPRGFVAVTKKGVAFLTSGERSLDFAALLKTGAKHAVEDVAGTRNPRDHAYREPTRNSNKPES